jgi:hypothetical protein
MYVCPVCSTPSIGFFRKWLSYPTLPAYCLVCKSHSHAHRTSGGVGLVVAALVIAAFGVIASALKSGWPLVFGIVVALAYNVWRVHRLQLEPLSPEMVSRARTTETMNWIALLIAFLFS